MKTRGEPGDRSGRSERRVQPCAPKHAGGILFQDRNNRNLEKLEQAQIQNGTMLRVCADLLKSCSDLMRAAISERI